MIRNIFLVMRGTVLAQLIGFLALPYLARLFEPAAFGHYQLFISLVTLALVLPTLRYEIALLRVEDGREYRDLVRLCLGLALAVTAVAAIIVAAIELSDWRKILADVPFSPWLVVVAMLIGGLAQVLCGCGDRNRVGGHVTDRADICGHCRACGLAAGTGFLGAKRHS